MNYLYGTTTTGHRVHLVGRVEGNYALSLCGFWLREFAEGPDFPKTLCDHCQRIRKAAKP